MITILDIKTNQALQTTAINNALTAIHAKLATVVSQADLDEVNATVLAQTKTITDATASL